MEKPYKKEDQLLKELIRESGLEHPSRGFSKNVMNAIEARSAKTPAYVPLISTGGWWVFGAAVAVTVLAVLVGSIEGFSELKTYLPADFFRLQYSLPRLEVSNIVLYAVGFTALFSVGNLKT